MSGGLSGVGVSDTDMKKRDERWGMRDERREKREEETYLSSVS